MEIQNIHNKQNFNGLYFKNVTPKVQKALEESPAIKKLSQNYDIFIKQYHQKTQKRYGTLLNYGLTYKVKEIVPNLFHKKSQFNKKCYSNFVLDPYAFPNKRAIDKVIEEDLIKEAELINMNFFKDYLK